MKKTVEEQDEALDMIDDILAEIMEKREEGFSIEELSPMMKEVFAIFREYCPHDEIVGSMSEIEEAFENYMKRRLH